MGADFLTETEEWISSMATDQAAKVEISGGQRRDVKLGFLIHDVSRMRRKVFDQLMKPHGITRAQWWVLACLSRQDGMTQVQLADILDVGKASLGTLIERLEMAGWIERRGDSVDKRVKRVYLARSAQSLLDKMSSAERLFNERAMIKLSADDRSELFRLLTLIKDTLSNMVVEDAPKPARNKNSGASGSRVETRVS